jgi:predicted glycosyltransferase
MTQEAQREFRRRARKLWKLNIIVFDSHIEVLMENATGIVAMGGYNTFCEILSFDKRAILVPRETPRLEQRIRADYASEHGLVSMLLYEDLENTSLMVDSLLKLPQQPLPSSRGAQLLLNGLENINQRVLTILDKH